VESGGGGAVGEDGDAVSWAIGVGAWVAVVDAAAGGLETAAPEVPDPLVVAIT